MRKLAAVSWAIAVCAAFGCIGYAIYLRAFVISDDAFDPMRAVSVQFLGAGGILFLASSAFASMD